MKKNFFIILFLLVISIGSYGLHMGLRIRRSLILTRTYTPEWFGQLYTLSATVEERAKHLGKNHPDVAKSLQNLAYFLSEEKLYNEAEPLLQRALAIREKALGKDHPDVAWSFIELAMFYTAKGKTFQAINFLSRGLDIEEQNLNILLATGSERQKQDSMKKISRSLNFAISFHIKTAPNYSKASHLALTTLLRYKGRNLDIMTNELQLLREHLTPENQQFFDKLASVRTQLATLIFNKPDNLPQEKYRQQVDALRKEMEQLEAELSRRSAEFRTLSELVTIAAVQQFIPEDAALVEFILYKPLDIKARQWGKAHYAAYILKSSGEPQWVDLGEAEAIHEAYYERHGFGQNLVLKASPALMKKSARSLDELLMKPIREKLGDVNHIIISPDGELNRIPFAALVDENNQYLIENYQITYLTTGRDLIRLKSEYPHR